MGSWGASEGLKSPPGCAHQTCPPARHWTLSLATAASPRDLALLGLPWLYSGLEYGHGLAITVPGFPSVMLTGTGGATGSQVRPKPLDQTRSPLPVSQLFSLCPGAKCPHHTGSYSSNPSSNDPL